MKALIVTRFFKTNHLTDFQKMLIESTSCLKIAVNNSGLNNFDYLLFHDYAHWKSYIAKYPDKKLITVKYPKRRLESIGLDKHFHLFYTSCREPNTPNKNDLFFKMGSIIPAIDFVTKEGATEILIVGDNKVHNQTFQESIKKSVKRLSEHALIYQCTESGNFALPTKSVEEFLDINSLYK